MLTICYCFVNRSKYGSSKRVEWTNLGPYSFGEWKYWILAFVFLCPRTKAMDFLKVAHMKYDGWWYYTKAEKSRAAKIFSTFRHFPTETFIFFKAERDYPARPSIRGRSQLAKGNGFAVAFITRSKAFQFVWINNLLLPSSWGGHKSKLWGLLCTHQL